MDAPPAFETAQHPPASRVPSLPVELLTKIAREASRDSLAFLHLTNKTFREIARPLLFQRLVFKHGRAVERRLCSVAQVPELASLVKSLTVRLLPIDAHRHRDRMVGTVAVAISLLPNLDTFVFDQNHSDVPLDPSIVFAILSHPSLRYFSFNRWFSDTTSFGIGFDRVRSHTLTIKEVSYVPAIIYYQEKHPTEPIAHVGEFYRRIRSFISRFDLHLQSLELSSLEKDGSPLPLLLLDPIPGLASLTLTTSSPYPPPPLLTETNWISLFLEKHPLVRRLKFDGLAAGEDLEDDGFLFLPWEAFSSVQSLEALGYEALVEWSSFGSMGSLLVELAIGVTGEREVVGLEVHHRQFWTTDVAVLSPQSVAGISVGFPKLQKLRINGSFDTPDLPQTISILASFPFLSDLRLPSSAVDNSKYKFCHHEADAVLDRLEDSSPWIFQVLPRPTTATGYFPPGSVTWPLEEEERHNLRDRVLSSGLHHGRTVKWLVAPLAKEWERVFEATPSLMEVQWDVWAGTNRLGTLKLKRSADPRGFEMDEQSKEYLDAEICSCFIQRDPERMVLWLQERPPLFDQPANFVPSQSLDTYFSRQE